MTQISNDQLLMPWQVLSQQKAESLSQEDLSLPDLRTTRDVSHCLTELINSEPRFGLFPSDLLFVSLDPLIGSRYWLLIEAGPMPRSFLVKKMKLPADAGVDRLRWAASLEPDGPGSPTEAATAPQHVTVFGNGYYSELEKLAGMYCTTVVIV